MFASENPKSKGSPEVATEDGDNSGVPLSERGKGENMPWDKRNPSWVFGLVGLTFFVLMIIALLGIIAYLSINTTNP